MSNKMPGCHLANAWRSRSKHILQWRYRNEVSVHHHHHPLYMYSVWIIDYFESPTSFVFGVQLWNSKVCRILVTVPDQKFGVGWDVSGRPEVQLAVRQEGLHVLLHGISGRLDVWYPLCQSTSMVVISNVQLSIKNKITCNNIIYWPGGGVAIAPRAPLSNKISEHHLVYI